MEGNLKTISGSSRLAFLALMGILALAIWLRLVNLSSESSSWVYVYNTDEGTYSYNTRNALLYGRWFTDEGKWALTVPVFAACQYGLAILLDHVDLVIQFRAISVAAGLLSILLIAFFFETWRDRALGATIWAISFMAVTHSRLAIAEPLLICFLQLAVLTAWKALQDGDALRSFLAGLLATGCAMVKLSGGFILGVLVLAPFFCDRNRVPRKKYFYGLAGGIAAGICCWAWFVGIPYWHEWRQMSWALTAYARSSVSFDLADLLNSYRHLFFSPALHSVCFLWMFSIFWCLGFIKRAIGKRAAPLEALCFWWIILAAGMLGLEEYQPARWQLILIPPVIWASLDFMNRVPRASTLCICLLLALAFSGCYSWIELGQFMETRGEIFPGWGLFSHVILTALACLSFLTCYSLCVAWAKNLNRKQAIMYSIIVLELMVQLELHIATGVHSSVPTTEWASSAQDLERAAGEEVVAGDLIEVMAIHSRRLHVLPTYLMLDETDDTSVRAFFRRQSVRPAYYLLADLKVPYWQTHMPAFMKSLGEGRRYRHPIGDVGVQDIHVFQIQSYDWLD